MGASWFKSLRRRVIQLLLVVLFAPVLLILLLRWVDPPTSSVIIQARVAAMLGDGHWRDIRQQWVDLNQISPSLQLAVIAAEDQRFDQHWGFDLDAISEALESRVRGGRLRGASTLSQQVAKNLFLSHSRSWLRKGAEAYLAAWLEFVWPKHRILEVYLNIAQFSGRDYGAMAASQSLFFVLPAQLSEQQAALLASALPDPASRHAGQPTPYLASRAAWIRGQMRQLGYAYLERLR